MDSFAFIHGSSEGQSTFVLPDSPTSVCNDIADKYFRGRETRKRVSRAKKSLYVEFYKDAKGDNYSVYSYVNSNCIGGKSSRPGQYFALTIMCRNTYFYPEMIFRMLTSAYNQMLEKGRIIKERKDGEGQYVIAQFDEASDFLSNFLKQINAYFDKVSAGFGKSVLDPKYQIADYDSWKGKKVNVDICNSMSSFKDFCTTGRLYISEEYESSEKYIQKLEEEVAKLKEENAGLENRISEATRSEKAKVQGELETLNSQINEKDGEIRTLKTQNDNYRETIEIVRGELEKYAKPDTAVADKRAGTDILKIGLLYIALILTILSSLMIYAFFRNLPLFTTSEEETSENVGPVQLTSTISGEENNTLQAVVPTILEISPTSIEAEAIGGIYKIIVTTDGKWNTPDSPNDWVRMARSDDSTLSVDVSSNVSQNMRECAFMIRSGNLEKQINITQKGKSAQIARVNYNVVVKDKTTGKILKDGAYVHNGQVLIATVTNANLANGFGWNYSNCEGKKGNLREVRVTVKIPAGKNSMVISYGDLSRDGYRERRSFKLEATSAEPSAEKSHVVDSVNNTSHGSSVGEPVE